MINPACMVGTQPDDANAGSGNEAQAWSTPALSVPTTAQEFLETLLPAPNTAIFVSYDLEGPAGLTGELDIRLAPGGYAREDWSMHVPVSERDSETVGFVHIRTPEHELWQGDTVGGQHASMLRALAERYLALAPEHRRDVIATIERWHASLREARQLHPGDQRTILGTSCLWTRIAAQSSCTWEEAGILLHYEGNAFTIRATRIELDSTFDADPFALPRASSKRAYHDNDRTRHDGALDAILQQLGRGDVTPLVSLTRSEHVTAPSGPDASTLVRSLAGQPVPVHD